jgi:hypothetical protein
MFCIGQNGMAGDFKKILKIVYNLKFMGCLFLDFGLFISKYSDSKHKGKMFFSKELCF